MKVVTIVVVIVVVVVLGLGFVPSFSDGTIPCPMLAIMTDKAFARFLGLVVVAALVGIPWLLLLLVCDNKSLFIDDVVALVAIDTSKSYISVLDRCHDDVNDSRSSCILHGLLLSSYLSSNLWLLQLLQRWEYRC